MSKSPSLTKVLLASTVLTASAPAMAQTVLPEIVVRGATIEAPPVKRPVVQPAVEEPEAPPPKSTARPSKPTSSATAPPSKPVSTPSSAPANQGTAAPIVSSPSAGATTGTTGNESGGIATDKIGTAVSVVSADDLRRLQVRDAADAMRSLPGVEISRTGSISGKTQVRIRGGEGNHTLVLIDGIEANDPNDGEYDFANLLVDDIERIEVIRGAQSGLYGSGALAGAVNIITKSGKGPLTVAVRSEVGSYRTTTNSARVSGGNENAWVAVTGQQRRTEGFNTSLFGDERDGSTLSNFSAKAGVKLADDITTEVVLRNTRNRLSRDGYGTSSPDKLAAPYDDLSKSMTSVWQTGINLRWDMLDGKLTHVWKANRTTTQSFDDDASYGSRSLNSSEANRYSYAATYRFETPMMVSVRHSVTGLVEKQTEAFTPFGDYTDGLERTRGLTAFAAEYRTEIADRLFLAGTVRRDDNDTFKDFTTWRSSASLKLPEIALRPHASIGTGVRLPTMFEQFGFVLSSFRPNPNLSPEESRGWDAGVEMTLVPGKASVDVTYFHTNLTNKINGFATVLGTTLSTSENLRGESLREGVETSAKVRVTNEITLSGAYTHLTATDPKGVDELRRPKHAGRVDASYAFAQGKGRFNIAAIYNGQMADRTSDINFDPVRVKLDDYWLVTAGASYKLQPGLEVYGRVENVLNERYQEVYGYNTPGLAAYAGVRITFEDKRFLAHSSDMAGK
jgi:vitamin B12 transporter